MHGPFAAWDDYYGPVAAESMHRALMSPNALTLRRRPGDLSAQVMVQGRAESILLGGSLSSIAMTVGWCCPSFDGAILLIEGWDAHAGAIDRALTQIRRSGVLEGVVGVAVGEFVHSPGHRAGKWSCIDLLYDHLGGLGVPVLGGLPIGHGPSPPTVALGTRAVLDTEASTLVVDPGVRSS